MGFSGWEEESYREEYVREERGREMKNARDFDVQQEELEDLFRPCTKEDPCGGCLACCEEERGSVSES